jgi:hypothetical protein
MPNVSHFIKDEISIAIQSKVDSLQDQKACSGVEVYLHRFLSTALDWEVSGQFQASATLPPRKNPQCRYCVLIL